MLSDSYGHLIHLGFFPPYRVRVAFALFGASFLEFHINCSTAARAVEWKQLPWSAAAGAGAGVCVGTGLALAGKNMVPSDF